LSESDVSDLELTSDEERAASPDHDAPRQQRRRRLALPDDADDDGDGDDDEPAAQPAASHWGPETAQWPVFWFSVTLSKKGTKNNADVPMSWWDRSVSFVNTRCEDGSAQGLERGDRKGNLHIQGWYGLRCDPALNGDSRAKYWSDQFKRFIPIGKYRPHSDSILMFKEKEDGQEYLPMLGYTMKDAGKEHHKHHSKSIPAETLRAAAATYDTVSTSYVTGMTKITRANLSLVIYGFEATQCAPMTGLSARRILLWMHQTGEYVPAPCWVTPPTGQYIDPVYLNLFYELARAPASATMGLIKAVYFYKRGHHFGPYDRRGLVDYRGHPKRKKDAHSDWGFDPDADEVSLVASGPEGAAALPTNRYNDLDDIANSGCFDYGTDDDETTDPWHGTNWPVAADIFSDMRTAQGEPPAPGANSAPVRNIGVHSPDFGARGDATDWAATARRNMHAASSRDASRSPQSAASTHDSVANDIANAGWDAASVMMGMNEHVPDESMYFKCDMCSLNIAQGVDICSACGSTEMTAFYPGASGSNSAGEDSDGDDNDCQELAAVVPPAKDSTPMSRLDYQRVFAATETREVAMPKSQKEAAAIAASMAAADDGLAAGMSGLTSQRATVPAQNGDGLSTGSIMINAIRDGRQAIARDALATAAEERGRAAARRGSRVRKAKAPFTPPK